MSEKISAGVFIAAIFAVLIALVAFPPAGIVVAVAVVWWFIKMDRETSRERVARIERKAAEREAAFEREQAELDDLSFEEELERATAARRKLYGDNKS